MACSGLYSSSLVNRAYPYPHPARYGYGGWMPENSKRVGFGK
ncbi:hypothetical protein [Pontibacter sp. E15-1]|nr:hypothetical protein [Pontibacter sp. E15-1]